MVKLSDDEIVEHADIGFFLPSQLEAADLQYLRRIALSELQTRAPRFSEFVHKWADDEAFDRARKDGKSRSPAAGTVHTLAMPPLHAYSDEQIAQTLEAIMIWSYIPDLRNEIVGRFIDRINMAVTLEAAKRIRTKKRGPQMEIEHDVFVDAEFLANRYKIKKQTVFDWLEQGKICPAFRFGKRLTRWRVSDIQAWEAEQLAEATANANRRREVKDAADLEKHAAKERHDCVGDAAKLIKDEELKV